MLLGTLLLSLLLQAAPAAKSTVVVGLIDGQTLAIDDATFSGFIQTREPGQSKLLYRTKDFHGELDLSSVQRIDFSYKKGKPFLLNVTLKNGQKLEVESDRRAYVTVTGPTGTGTVTVKHPDPIGTPVRLTSHQPNRKDDLTIQYLEFPR